LTIIDSEVVLARILERIPNAELTLSELLAVCETIECRLPEIQVTTNRLSSPLVRRHYMFHTGTNSKITRAPNSELFFGPDCLYIVFYSKVPSCIRDRFLCIIDSQLIKT